MTAAGETCGEDARHIELMASILELQQTAERVYEARPRTVGRRERLFGGEVVAQALVAASHTVPEGRTCHSAQARFLRPGRAATSLLLDVVELYEGNSFSTRAVTVRQEARAILHMTASFHRVETGIEHQPDEVSDMPDLRMALDAGAVAERADARTARWLRFVRSSMPLEIAFPEMPPRVATAGGARLPPRHRMWVRIPQMSSDIERVGALMYASDLGLMSAATLPHGYTIPDPRLRGSSLDHALWLHRCDLAAGWLLFDYESPWAGSGRALCRSYVRATDGALVASVVQEALIRQVAGPANAWSPSKSDFRA